MSSDMYIDISSTYCDSFIFDPLLGFQKELIIQNIVTFIIQISIITVDLKKKTLARNKVVISAFPVL